MSHLLCLFMGVKVREYIRREHVKPVLRFLTRIILLVGVILLLNVIGLSFFLFSKGQWNLFSFIELLIILLLLEGCVIGAAGGGLAFFGYIEYWSTATMIAGVLLIFLGLLVSSWTSI